MLRINLQPIFKARGIDKPHRFLGQAGFTRHCAASLVDGSIRYVQLDHIELLCEIFICEPHDFLYWSPDSSNTHLSADHPLHNLKKAGSAPDLKRTIENMPYNKLKEAVENIAGSK